MSTDRETTRIVRSWLEEGVTSLPDPVLDAVLDQLPATPQRRAGWLARRFPHMNQAMRITLAAATVVAVALIGLGYLRSQNTGDPGLDDPTPTSTPMSFPSGSSATAPLEPGRYVAADPFPARLTFSVPGAWEGTIGGPYATLLERTGANAWINFVLFDQVAVDPCQSQEFLDSGPTVDDLATALGEVPGLEVTEVGAITVDGYQGTQLLMVAPESFGGCTLGQDGYVVWRLPLGALHTMAPGEQHRVWILDVDGQRIVVSYPEPPQVTDELRAEIEAILDSLDIEPGS